MAERCETCGKPAYNWDYDQMMYFCDRDVQQPTFTVPILDDGSVAPPATASAETKETR